MPALSMGVCTLRIDGHDLAVAHGSTVLAAARKAGIPIPTLCQHEEIGRAHV